MSVDLANRVIALRLSRSQEQRMDDLLEKAVRGTLEDDESRELTALNHIADRLSRWQSQARLFLRTKS